MTTETSTFPAVPLAGIKVKSITPTLVSTSQSLARQVRDLGVHRFHLTAQIPPLSRTEARALLAFLSTLRGQATAFRWQPPLTNRASYSQGPPQAVVGSAQVNYGAGYAAGATSIAIDTLLSSWVPAAGDHCTFAGHSQVYGITGYSGGAITISPGLQTAVADNVVITRRFAGQFVVCDNFVGTLYAGDMIQFHGLPKVYVVTKDVTVAGTGTQFKVELNTPVVGTVYDNLHAHCHPTSSDYRPWFTLALDSDTYGLDLGPAEIASGITLGFVEVT